MPAASVKTACEVAAVAAPKIGYATPKSVTVVMYAPTLLIDAVTRYVPLAGTYRKLPLKPNPLTAVGATEDVEVDATPVKTAVSVVPIGAT